MTRSLALLVVALLATATHADSWATPTPRVFANVWGSHGFKVMPNKDNAFAGPADAVLFQLDDKGDEKPVWKGRLVNQPHQAFVAPNGKHVVTIDTYGRLGFKHAVVVYDDKGKAVADLALEDVLTADEIMNNVLRTVSSRHWTRGAKFAFADDATTFDIDLKWGRTLKLDLTTGKVR